MKLKEILSSGRTPNEEELRYACLVLTKYCLDEDADNLTMVLGNSVNEEKFTCSFSTNITEKFMEYKKNESKKRTKETTKNKCKAKKCCK